MDLVKQKRSHDKLLLPIIVCCGVGLITLSGCDCKEVADKQYYPSYDVKSVVTRNCDNEILRYDHYNINGKKCFVLAYENNAPKKAIEGSAWIHFIHDTPGPNDYVIGDTMSISIDMATPPMLESRLYVEHNGNKINLSKDSKYRHFESSTGDTTYIYKAIASKQREEINFIGVYYLNGEKWVTFKRNQPYIIDAIRKENTNILSDTLAN